MCYYKLNNNIYMKGNNRWIFYDLIFYDLLKSNATFDIK